MARVAATQPLNRDIQNMLPFNPGLLIQLGKTAEDAIRDVLKQGGTRSARPTGEVSAVRAVTLDGFDKISTAWEPIMRHISHSLELTAIFTHCRPHVKFKPVHYVKGTGRCELADLFIVMDHKNVRGEIIDRRAALIQAKLLKNGGLRLSGSEWTQHELLTYLPTFTFLDARYDIRPRALKAIPFVGDPAFTAEYGGVELGLMPLHWAHWLPQQPNGFFAEISIGRYLAGMTTNSMNCGREAEPNGNDDWSFTVDELLRVTGALPIVKRAPHVLRKNRNVIGFITDAAAYFSNPKTIGAGGGPEKPEEEESWEEGPISVVHLTLQQDEGPG